MINVLADQYLYNIKSYLPERINLQLFDPAHGLPSEINHAHAMLIRTVIPINKQTMPNIPKQLSFIGTGSSGTDHVDSQYLANHNIHFADAAGCNARSVAEYVATALLIWADQRDKELQELSVGIVGVGQAGTQAKKMLDKIGIQTVAYDPPREQRDPDFSSASLNKVLACDILSFHTPLNKEGQYPTYHWLNKIKLTDTTFNLIINAARGGVVDETALLAAMKQGKIRDIVIDVWENEPEINLTTARKAFIKTPHIAGYSVQAKENASKFIAEALINHFDLQRPPSPSKKKKTVFEKNPDEFESLTSLLTELHPVKKYERRLTKIIKEHSNNRGVYFNKLRAEFPLRQQFEHIHLPTAFFTRYPVLKNLGFRALN